jgi:UDP-N-acetyl-D-galactosamine dehydrogenase
VTEDVVGSIIAAESRLPAGLGFHLGYSPERINPGDEIHSLERMVKVVAGDCSVVTELLTAVYGKLTGGRVHQSVDIRTAEAAKVVENTQRDLNIALMNELAMICDRLDLDTREVIRTASTKWNFFPHEPGLVGGHCIGVDPYYLLFAAAEAGHHAQLVTAGRQVNASMGRYISDRVISLLGSNKRHRGRVKTLILGLTFKENIPDIRNSQVVDIIDYLERHNIDCSVFDPVADPKQVHTRCGIKLLHDPTVNAPFQVIIAAVRHSKIVSQFPLETLRAISADRSPLLIDVKSMYDRSQATSAGFVYWRL